jgi:hypothetical protein
MGVCGFLGSMGEAMLLRLNDSAKLAEQPSRAGLDGNRSSHPPPSLKPSEVLWFSPSAYPLSLWLEAEQVLEVDPMAEFERVASPSPEPQSL